MAAQVRTTVPEPPARARHSPVDRIAAAALTAGAGAVHLAVVPAHLHEYLPFGSFFRRGRGAQIIAAATVLRTARGHGAPPCCPRRRFCSRRSSASAPASRGRPGHGCGCPQRRTGSRSSRRTPWPRGSRCPTGSSPTKGGTFWYHSHQDTGNQIPAGLFGALVVDPVDGGRADVDTTVLLHDTGFGAIAANGTTGDQRVDARPGRPVRLRVIDAVALGWTARPRPASC